MSAGKPQPLEFRAVGPGFERPLAAFFQELRDAGDAARFHPHPLTDEHAGVLCRYAGKDLYYVAVEGGAEADARVLAYGMLRGWDEGYEVPSLGIAVGPAARGGGLGRAFMLFLHAAARRRGAPRIRLKVYPDNDAALSLYRSLGYQFAAEEGGQAVGVFSFA